MALINKTFIALLLLSLAVATRAYIARPRYPGAKNMLMMIKSSSNGDCCEDCLDRATTGRASCSDQDADCEYGCESSCTCTYFDSPQCSCSTWHQTTGTTSAPSKFKSNNNVLALENN